MSVVQGKENINLHLLLNIFNLIVAVKCKIGMILQLGGLLRGRLNECKSVLCIMYGQSSVKTPIIWDSQTTVDTGMDQELSMYASPRILV